MITEVFIGLQCRWGSAATFFRAKELTSTRFPANASLSKDVPSPQGGLRGLLCHWAAIQGWGGGRAR